MGDHPIVVLAEALTAGAAGAAVDEHEAAYADDLVTRAFDAPDIPVVRTHSVYRLACDTLAGTRAEVVVCRGCGTRWPAARTDIAELEQQPCDPRSDR